MKENNKYIEEIFKKSMKFNMINKKYLYQKYAGSGKTYNSLHLLDFNVDLERYYNKNLFIYLTKIKSNRTDLCNKFFRYYKNNEFKYKYEKTFKIKNIIINKKEYDYEKNINNIDELIEKSKNEQNETK